MLAQTFELRDKSRIVRVSHYHTKVPQPAAVFYSLHGRVPEDPAEILFAEFSERFERWIEKREVTGVETRGSGFGPLDIALRISLHGLELCVIRNGSPIVLTFEDQWRIAIPRLTNDN